MRLFLIIAVCGAVLATVALAVYVRQIPMPADRWHVDPAEVTPRASRSYHLLRGAEAPRLSGTPQEVASRLDRFARTERAVPIAGDPDSGHVTYVVRSRLFGFPDAVSVRFYPEGDLTRVEIFSRSGIGDYDWGVNAARVARWIDAAGS